MIKTRSRNKASFGGALVYIFIGVLLFGALAFSFAKGMRSGSTDTMDEKTAKIRAMEIVNYTQQINNRVQNLLMSGCSETQLNFEYVLSGSTLYVNPLAPADGSCDVFAAGKVPFISLKQMGVDVTSGSFVNKKWHFTSYIMSVAGIGADTKIDLTVQAIIDRETCIQINKIIGIDVDPTTLIVASTFGGNAFTGVFYNAPGRVINPSGTPLYRKETGCYYSAVFGGYAYLFYKTLIPK